MKNLKVKIGEYEVSISAKSESSETATKQDTMNFLCYMSMFAASADRMYITDGKPQDGFHRKAAERMSDDIYNFLSENHYYETN